MDIKFKENLKSLRKEKGLSQTALAQLLNTTVKTVSHWETGYTEPSLKQLAEISVVFDVSIDDLLF